MMKEDGKGFFFKGDERGAKVGDDAEYLKQTYGVEMNEQKETLQKRAEERWKPYSDIDFYVASQKMDEKEFQALRSEAKFAHDDYKFISEEADNFSKQVQQQQKTQLQEQAKEAR